MLDKASHTACVIEFDIIEALDIAAHGNNGALCTSEFVNNFFSYTVDVIAFTVKDYAVELIKINKFNEIKLIVTVLSVLPPILPRELI